MTTRLHGQHSAVPYASRSLAPASNKLQRIPASMDSHKLPCKGRNRRRSASHVARLQQMRSTAGSQAALTDSQQSIESVIADVLNANKAKVQRPADLLSLLDSSGNGITTTVNRSWDTTAVTLQIKGSWQKSAEARKMAMLTVYQERQVRRASILLHFFRYLVKSSPDLLDQETVQQLEAAAVANQLNPAVEVLLVPQLTQMAAGVYPWSVLHRVLETAVQEATNSLFARPPYSYSTARRQAAQQQLQLVEASLARGAAFARLRAVLLQQGQLQHWQQQQATAAAGGSARMLTAEQAFYDSWQQQQQHYTAEFSPMQGKCMHCSFRQRSSKAPYLLQHSPGTAAAGSSKTAAAAAAVDGAAAGEVHLVCDVITRLTDQVRALRAAIPGGRESTLGVLPEVQRCYRSALLDLCIGWAELSPAVVMDPLPAAAAVARVAISSLEHDRLLRRIGMESSGVEVQVMRQLSQSKGRSFLAHFSPTVGNPFGQTTEWDYFRECPGVWSRFVADPPTETAILTFKPVTPWQQQQQQANSTTSAAAAAAVAVQLSHQELQQLIYQLVTALSGSSSSNNNKHARQQVPAAAVGIPGTRSITLQPAAAGSSSSAYLGGQSDPQLLLLIDGVIAAELSPAHITSFVTVIDDLVTQLPGQYSTAVQDVKVLHASPGRQLLSSLVSWFSSSSKTLAAAALLALPLLAIARPFRGLQHVPVPPAAAAVMAAVAPAGAAASSSVRQQQQQRARLLPVNDYLIDAEMQQLCEIVQQQVAGKIWLPDTAIPSSSRGGGGSSSSSPEAAAVSSNDLMYQVVVDRQALVLGCKPCSSAAAAAYQELPLTAVLQGPSLAKIQERRLSVMTSADSSSAKSSKKGLKPSSSKAAYASVPYTQIPEDGAVVLKLVLKPATKQAAGSAAAAEADSSSQQQQQQGDLVISKTLGTGKSAVRFVLLEPVVTSWTDEDSIRAWAASGSVLHQSPTAAVAAVQGNLQGQDLQGLQQVAGAAKLVEGEEQAVQQERVLSGKGLQLSLDGQKVESLEALVQQLLQQQQQQQQSSGDNSSTAHRTDQ